MFECDSDANFEHKSTTMLGSELTSSKGSCVNQPYSEPVESVSGNCHGIRIPFMLTSESICHSPCVHCPSLVSNCNQHWS